MHGPVVPAVVVFGDGSKTAMKRALRRLAPEVAPFVHVHKVPTGRPRCELHCPESKLQLVRDLVRSLNANGMSAVVYVDQSKPVSKADQAAEGLAAARARAGLPRDVCRYFDAGQACPFHGRCRFTCYATRGGGR